MQRVAGLGIASIQQLHDGGVAVAGGVGVAEKHPLAVEHDVVVPARGRRDVVLQMRGDGLRPGIDQRERGHPVVVLQRPDEPGSRIVFEPVDPSGDRIGMHHFAGPIVLHDRAVAGDHAGGIDAVAIFREQEFPGGRERIKPADAVGRDAEHF